MTFVRQLAARLFQGRPLLNEVDLHIVAMLILIVPASCLLPSVIWSCAIIFAVPQGRILTRVFVDYPAFKRPALPYFIANELMAVAATALCVIVWSLF